MPHHRHELPSGLPPAQHNALVAAGSPDAWQDAVVYGHQQGVGYRGVNAAMPMVTTSNTASPATYASAAAVLDQ